MVTIAERLQHAYNRITQAAKNVHRESESITLIAVAKKKPATAIEHAYQQGQRHFAESYLQEALAKIAQLTHCQGIIWHFIGPVQSNKTKAIAEHFQWVQSVDREKIALRLNSQRPAHLPPLQVLIQVNIDNDANKSGCTLAQLPALAEVIHQSTNLLLRGVMVIPAKYTVPDKQLAVFQQAQACFVKLQTQYPTVDTLSMGMSHDMQHAIEAGSTMVRLGTAIFGEREN